MPTTSFDKDSIKASIIGKLQRYNGVTVQEATPQQLYKAVASTVRDQIMQKWMVSRRLRDAKRKRLYYLSVEFLTGRSLNCNLINLCSQENYAKALSELGIDLPETWTDLYQRVLPRLYENNMSFSLPVDTSVSSNSPGALRGFTMLLLQMGGEYYNGDGESSALDTPEAYKAFKFWTDMYANYGIDAESNFFTRIRTGTMPIGISNYTGYLQLLTSAPELYGRWSIAPVPGTVQADGTVSHAVGTTASTAGVILSQSDKQEAAWTFLKWWMSAETQTRYGRELEAILGTGARWNTANVESFFSLPWDARHAQIIKAQMESAREQMIVPGGYFTGRHIINAWNSVVVNNKDARDMLEKAVKDINKELNNKRKEFGLDN